MADPAHEAELDDFDQTQVRLYRSGLTMVALALLLTAVVHIGAVITGAEGQPVVRDWVNLAWIGVVYGAGLAVSNMHLYDKRIRWVIRVTAWFGTVMVLTSFVIRNEVPSWWVFHMGLGFVFVALSGFALKERYCFRLPLLYLVPVCLAGSLLPLLMDWWLPSGLVLLVAGAVMAFLSIRKDRMPLHYDYGDPAQYQV